jgi:RNA polymerase sigma factor (sigma-70 family)
MRTDSPVTDLVTLAQSGDQQAWDALVERYAPLVWSICRRYQLSPADADDVGQNVWLRLVDSLGQMRDPAALPGWLATTTRRECCRLYRRAHRSQHTGLTPGTENMPDGQALTAEQEVLIAERQAAFREAFADLPAHCQRLLSLLIEDPPAPYAQISAQLGIAIGTIGPARNRCLHKLRRHPAIAALINAETDQLELARS